MSTLRTSIVLVVLLMSAAAAAADPSPIRPGGPRVRPHDARSAALVLEALERSQTIRALVEALESRDVIVYVQVQPMLKERLAGSLTWVTSTGKYRYVRISWNPLLSTATAIATLGHELQHALEVADNPAIVSDTSLADFYRINGISMRAHNGWDTLAARDRGDAVRREIASVRATRPGDIVLDFTPDSWQLMYQQARGGY
jgi:hypothetical protein